MGMLIGTTAKDVARALTRIAGRKVVYVASVGDAASPVWLVAGQHSQQIGQCADYRHNVEVAAERNGALYVEGSWDQEHGWLVGAPEEHTAALCDTLRATTVERREAAQARRGQQIIAEMERREAERPAEEAARAKYTAECEARATEYRPLYEQALAKVRTNAKGKPHGEDTRTLEWAFAKACGTRDCCGQYDLEHGLKVLKRLATEGFATA